MIKSSLLFIAIFFLVAKSVFAFDFNSPNNKFGIHLAQPHTEAIQQAANLVNSSGGDWGYITLVMQENDRNTQKWQDIFDQLRTLHLIPIVRLATTAEGENWKRPTKNDVGSWVQFLNSLNWVIQNRYVILFNEPNHGQEWGGVEDAQNYADVTKELAQELKNSNPDYFVMLAAFDASAPSSPPNFEDEYYFLQNVINRIGTDDFQKLFDGWASHSYPNPGFAGSALGSGRGTVRTYQWEINTLKNFGISKNLPVFITETGWSADSLPRNTIANNLIEAFENIWLPDPQVIAVTPFVLDYQSPPFLGFSWRQQGSDAFYPQYNAVQSLSKIKGKPKQIEKAEISADLPSQLVVNSSYHFHLTLKNLGESIFDRDQGYSFRLQGGTLGDYFFSDLKNIKPGMEVEVDLSLKTGEETGKKSVKVVLTNSANETIAESDWQVETKPLPELSFIVNLFPKLKTIGNDFEIQVFDKNEELVFDKTGVKVQNGSGMLTDIQNIVLERPYRVVILKPYYLPRQTFVTFKDGENQAGFKAMLPLDFNQNGRLDSGDLLALFKNFQLFKLLLP